MKARWYPLHALPHKLQHAWVHPEHGAYFSSITGSHAKDANELGFKGEYGQEARENAMRSGLVRYYKIPSAEVGVEFDPQHKGAAEMAKKLIARHAIPGKHILAEVPGDYYHGTSLKDAHDFIDRVSSGRKETDYARMKRELGEDCADALIRHALDESYLKARHTTDESEQGSGKWIVFHGGRDFDQLDARALGSGEPGNIRPLGKGFYGGLSTGEHDTHTAIDLAKIYGRKYGGMIHAFEVTPKPGDVNFGSWVHEPLLSDADHKWRAMHDKATSLPVGPERRAAFDAADEFRKTLPKGKFSTASVYVAGQPAIEFHTDPKALGDLKRIGKWSVDTPTEHIAKAVRGGSVSESLCEALSPDEAKKITVKLDPEMEGLKRAGKWSSKHTWFHIQHADHGKIGDFSGPVTDGHLNVQNMGLDKEYLQKQGIDPGRDYGNWWSSADVLRDHKIASNHLGVAGIRQITRELRQKHGITSIGSTERVTGTRLKAYARGRRVPRDGIKSFVTKTRRLGESRADFLIRMALREGL